MLMIMMMVMMTTTTVMMMTDHYQSKNSKVRNLSSNKLFLSHLTDTVMAKIVSTFI